MFGILAGCSGSDSTPSSASPNARSGGPLSGVARDVLRLRPNGIAPAIPQIHSLTHKDKRPVLVVADVVTNTVTEYASPYTGAPIATITKRVDGPMHLAFHRHDLFVANSSNSTVTEYVPPYTGAPIATISNGSVWPARCSVRR